MVTSLIGPLRELQLLLFSTNPLALAAMTPPPSPGTGRAFESVVRGNKSEYEIALSAAPPPEEVR